MTLFLSRPGGRIAYDVTGDGPLVVLAPGMGDLRAAWRHVAPALVAAGHRVATLDLRGHGESDVFDAHTPADVAGDLLALVAELGGPATLVGHSAAAAAAVNAAADAPDAVRALVLVGPVVRDGGPKGAWAQAAMRLLLQAAFLPFWGAWAWTQFYRSLFVGGQPVDHEAHVAAVRASLGSVARRRAMLEVGLSTKAACAARVGDVVAPVLAIVGDRDPDFDPAAEAAWLASALRADVHLLPGVGHDPHMEVAAQTSALINGFLKGAACRAA